MTAKEIYNEELKRFKVIENNYKNELIKEAVELIKNSKIDLGLNSKYERKYGWGKGLTTENIFGDPLKTFGVITRCGDMPDVTTAEKLSVNEIETIINNIKNL